LLASDTFLTIVYLLFDERSPKKSDDYWRGLTKAASVFTGVEAKSVFNYESLIGSHRANDKY
jgi:hypothetical protein